MHPELVTVKTIEITCIISRKGSTDNFRIDMKTNVPFLKKYHWFGSDTMIILKIDMKTAIPFLRGAFWYSNLFNVQLY